MEKLVLIDGNSLINRAFYAMPVLSTKDGVFTNAVYGFMNMFFKMLNDEKPKYVAVAFDLKSPTFRHKMYSEYKGTRKPMPEELRPQIPLLKELLTLMGIRTVEKEGFEADDLIGTIAKNTSIKTLIYTGDKDSFQLVDNETNVYFTKHGLTDIDVYTIDNFKDKTELNPSQIIELKALMGDSSDNIPGVSGIGEKTAKNLLLQYGDIENLYNNIHKLTGKLKEKIENGKDMAFLSKTLATIDVNVDIDTSLTSMEFEFPFSNEVKKRFSDLEFKSIIKREDIFSVDNDKKESPVAEMEKLELVICKDLSMFKEATSKPEIFISLFFDKINFYSQGGKEYSFKIMQNLLDDGVNLSELLPCLEDLFLSDKKFIVFNKKELRHFIKNNLKKDINFNADDVSLLNYIADFSGGEESLLDLLFRYDLDKNLPSFGLYKCYDRLVAILKEMELENLYKTVELPLSDVLYGMETEGFKVDSNALFEAGKVYAEKIDNLEQKIRALAENDTLNVNSPKQLGELLFEKMKLSKGKKTKSGYSTNAEVLEGLYDVHPIIPLILDYRKLQKIRSTYIEGFKPLIDKKTGLVHTTFHQTLTATGRLSSKEPNLQNIPVRDDDGREIRKFFVPKYENGILIGADYSQIELRLLAAFSGCKGLIEAFKNGVDVHRDTASKVFMVDIKDVTSAMRRSAKAVNFGIIYGISEYGLAKNIGVSPRQAREYIDAYFKTYPEVKEYMSKNVEFAKENGFVKTVLGRRRYIRELSSSNYNLRSFGERVAMNMPLQGSSADIIKIAMINVDKRLKENSLKSRLILQVHDELIIDAVLEEKEMVERILKEEMESAVKLTVSLDVEVGSGKTWYEAK